MEQFAAFMERKGFIGKAKEVEMEKNARSKKAGSGNHGDKQTKTTDRQAESREPEQGHDHDLEWGKPKHGEPSWDRERNQDRNRNEGQGGRGNDNIQTVLSPSDVTIYKRAVALSLYEQEGDEPENEHDGKKQNEKVNRCSSSSDELVNTSDESVIDISNYGNIVVDQRKGNKQQRDRRQRDGPRYIEDGAVAHTSRRMLPPPPLGPRDDQLATQESGGRQHGTEIAPAEKAEKLICQAELAKARIYEVPGIDNVSVTQNDFNELLHSVIVDEGYFSIEAHVDESVKRRIMSDEYVDFARLLPRGRGPIIDEEEKGFNRCS